MTRSRNDIEVNNESGTVAGLFQDQPTAEAAIKRLLAAGFTEAQIGVAVRDREQQQALTESTGTQATEDATKGAVGGGVVGGVIGLLAGVGALAIPGIGPILAGGALASTLAGAGIGAAAGGLLGALVGMGVPEEEARHFEQGFQEGGILVTVQAGDRAEPARQALSEGGADLGPSYRGLGTSRTEVPDTAAFDIATSGVATAGVGAEGRERLELREEELDVDTREGREVSGQGLGEEEVRIPLMEEEVDVQKRAVVREEISIGKQPVQETKTVSDTVRREEAMIESQGDVGTRPFEGRERRRTRQPAYGGPERRAALQR